MRALTLQRPWHVLMIRGHKLVENRSWAPRTLAPGERFAVHAGKGWDGRAVEMALRRGLRAGRSSHGNSVIYDDLLVGVHSAVVGTVQFDGLVEDPAIEPWWMGLGQELWRLSQPRALARPVPCRGALGLWSLPDAVAAVVLSEGG